MSEIVEEDIDEECLCPICINKPIGICLCKACPIWVEPSEDTDITSCERAKPCWFHSIAKRFPKKAEWKMSEKNGCNSTLVMNWNCGYHTTDKNCLAPKSVKCKYKMVNNGKWLKKYGC